LKAGAALVLRSIAALALRCVSKDEAGRLTMRGRVSKDECFETHRIYDAMLLSMRERSRLYADRAQKEGRKVSAFRTAHAGRLVHARFMLC
jgi:hypothetical protein